MDEIESDKTILNKLIAILSNYGIQGSPYSPNGNNYAKEISEMPLGLRCMSSTNLLNTSLGLDDLGWHFLNFNDSDLVAEIDFGLRELGLYELAALHMKAFNLISPYLDIIRNSDVELDSLLKFKGRFDEMSELCGRAWKANKQGEYGAIYQSWINYARLHPDKVFTDQANEVYRLHKNDEDFMS